MSAAPGEMFALSETLLPEVAGHHRSAVTIHPVGEVLAGETDPGPLPVLKLFCVDVAPLLHRPSGISTSVLSENSVAGQVASEKFPISCRETLPAADSVTMKWCQSLCGQGAGMVPGGETGSFPVRMARHGLIGHCPDLFFQPRRCAGCLQFCSFSRHSALLLSVASRPTTRFTSVQEHLQQKRTVTGLERAARMRAGS